MSRLEYKKQLLLTSSSSSAAPVEPVGGITIGVVEGVSSVVSVAVSVV